MISIRVEVDLNNKDFHLLVEVDLDQIVVSALVQGIRLKKRLYRSSNISAII